MTTPTKSKKKPACPVVTAKEGARLKLDPMTEVILNTVSQIRAPLDLKIAEQSVAIERLSDALRNAVADMQWVINAIHEVSDPKSERPVVWKDVALMCYAAMNRAPGYRAALNLTAPADGKKGAK